MRIALKLGVSQTIVGHWVNAENFPLDENLTKLAHCLDTTVEFLQKGEENTPIATTVSQEAATPRKPSLPDPEVILSARSQIAAACPDAVEIEIVLRFKEFGVRV